MLTREFEDWTSEMMRNNRSYHGDWGIGLEPQFERTPNGHEVVDVLITWPCLNSNRMEDVRTFADALSCAVYDAALLYGITVE